MSCLLSLSCVTCDLRTVQLLAVQFENIFKLRSNYGCLPSTKWAI